MGINDKKLNNKRFNELISHTKEYLELNDKVTVVAISKEEMKERSGFGRISVVQYTLETAEITYVKRKTGYNLGTCQAILRCFRFAWQCQNQIHLIDKFYGMDERIISQIDSYAFSNLILEKVFDIEIPNPYPKEKREYNLYEIYHREILSQYNKSQ